MSEENDKLIISHGLTVQNMDYANELQGDFDGILESDTEESEEEDTEDKDGDENVDTTWQEYGEQVAKKVSVGAIVAYMVDK